MERSYQGKSAKTVLASQVLTFLAPVLLMGWMSPCPTMREASSTSRRVTTGSSTTSSTAFPFFPINRKCN